jgi:hypothetical protein
MTFTATEILNTLATMPERSKATICGCRVERILFGYSVNGGSVQHGREAAEQIHSLAAGRGSARQLGDLATGTWFRRADNLMCWVVTDGDALGRDDRTLCVQPSTGASEILDNSETVHLCDRPY